MSEDTSRIACHICEEAGAGRRWYRNEYPRKSDGEIDWDRITGVVLCPTCTADTLEAILATLSEEQRAEVWRITRRMRGTREIMEAL